MAPFFFFTLMSDDLNHSHEADLEDTTFSTLSFVSSSIQELIPPDLAPSSLTNVTECQVQAAQVLPSELSQPIVNATLHNQDLPLQCHHDQSHFRLVSSPTSHIQKLSLASSITSLPPAWATRSSLLSNSRMPEEPTVLASFIAKNSSRLVQNLLTQLASASITSIWSLHFQLSLMITGTSLIFFFLRTSSLLNLITLQLYKII